MEEAFFYNLESPELCLAVVSLTDIIATRTGVHLTLLIRAPAHPSPLAIPPVSVQIWFPEFH